MNKFHFIFLFVMIQQLVFSQKIIPLKIVSGDDKLVINNAKVITDIGVYFTNDDGDLEIEYTNPSIIVSAPRFESKTYQLSKNQTSEISLNPIVEQIEEVNITPIDLKKILKKTLEDYKKIYHFSPSIYSAVIKQKGYMNDGITNLLIADVNIWSSNNVYNFAKGAKIDDFLQMSYQNLKYYKTNTKRPDYPFNGDVHLIPDHFAQKMFLNAQIVGMLNSLQNIKVNARIVNNTAGIQRIEFKTVENPNVDFQGYLIYNTNDSAITYLELEGKHPKENTIQEKNTKGEAYLVRNDSFLISYDYTKKNDKYIPSNIRFIGKGVGIYKGKDYQMNFQQEIIFQKHIDSNKKGIKNKIDLRKRLTDNIPSGSEKTNPALLSAEEQKFVDER